MNNNIREPAVAGAFYPRSPRQLRSMIQGYMDEAKPEIPSGKIRALIVPHAGYVYSGPVAAFGYKLLQNTKYMPKRVLIMGPAHRVWFPGAAFPSVSAFATPLGEQPVDAEAARVWADSSDVIGIADSPHAAEHCLEVQYPFIQTLYPDVPTLPLLCGEVNPTQLAEAITGCQTDADEDLIIVSSDLSHYLDNATAHRTDRQFVDAVLAGDERKVASGEACGRIPIMVLLHFAKQHGWQPHLLDYRTSGDVMGDTHQVVGYAAIAFTEAV